MADGSGSSNYIDEATKEFFLLFEKNKFSPLYLSVRCALRLLPLVAKASVLNQKIKNINSVKYNLLEIIIILKRSVGVVENQLLSEKYLGERYQIQIPEQCEAYVRRYLELIQVIYIYSNDAAADNAQALGYYSSCCVVELDAVQNESGIATYSFEEDMQFIKDRDFSVISDRTLWLGKKHSNVIDAYRNELLPLLNEMLVVHDHKLNKQFELIKLWYERISGFDVLDDAKRVISDVLTYENDLKTIDALNRKSLVDALENKFKHNSNTGHLTLGLLGHWGSGKTRILNLLKDRLFYKNNRDKNPDFIWGEFNAWAYEHTENIQAGMAHEIIQALTQNPISFDEGKERKAIVDDINQNLSPNKNKITDNDHDNRVERKIYFRRIRFNVGNFFCWQLFRKIAIAGGFVARKHPFKLTQLSAIILVTVIICTCVVLGVISEERTPLKDLISSDGAKFGVFGTLLALLYWITKNIKQVFAQPYTKELLTYVKLPSYSKHLGLVSEMRKDIKLLCKQRLQRGWRKPEKRLIFVVDDLDRCSPEGIVKTLEAVRLILDVENVTVIIAVDQRIALAALAYHYQKIQSFHASGDARTIARDYLGKIIHLPINIPEPDMETVKGYMGYVWRNDNEHKDELDWRSMVTPEDKANVDQAINQQAEPIKTGGETESYRKITAEDLAKLILEEPLPEAIKPKAKPERILTGLTPEQKAAFVYWTNQFELTNPRQLKRMHNSYNLLQLVSEKIDEVVNVKHHLAFGYLVTLITLEFVNDQTNLALAKQLKQYFFTHDWVSDSNNSEVSINEIPAALQLLENEQLMAACKKAREVIHNAADQLMLETSNQDTLKGLFLLVNAFVLPAIEINALKNSTLNNK